MIQDYEELYDLALKGDSYSQNSLGAKFAQLGGEENNKKALRWYLEAARSGYVDSIWNLATMIINGEGCEKNIELAKCLIEIAANSGCDSACLFLSDCYESNVNGYKKDLELSKKWEVAAWDFENESDFTDPDILKSILEGYDEFV